ncbi:MAG: hypothetical protein VB071_09075 [Lawsonibacter sp.]|nr:hypothetical protein [Lawsonibacter sp.]
MSKFKTWLINKFLPAYCRDALKEENSRLCGIVAEQKQEISRLNAYIDGFETAARLHRRITINTGEVRKRAYSPHFSTPK